MDNVTSLTSKRGNTARFRNTSPRISRIYLLGAMRVIGESGGNILPEARKTQAILAYLCLSEGDRLSRSRIAGVIWDRSGEAQARDSLRHALYELDRAGGSWRLERDRQTVRLDTTACWIDAFETPERSDLLLDDLHGISPSFDQWLVGERARFELRWQTILEKKLDDLARLKAAPELRAAAARKLLNVVSTHERAVRSMMRAFVEMGEPAEAIREFERFRLAADARFGMPPSAKTVALYEAIRVGSHARTARPSHRTLPGEPATPAGQQAEPIGTETRSATPLREVQPSIAVLPFRSLSAEADQHYVAEGVAEDLVEALSRVPGLFVISRLSAAAFRNQDRPPREIGETLGVRYVLSGSMRISGERLRLIVELTDASTGEVLWLSRRDENFSDLLEVQNRLAEAVVRSIAPHLRSAEVKRVRIKRPEHHDAYDLLLRAQENMNNPSRAVFETSEQLFDLAISRQPEYATALAWRAYWHVMRVGQGWSPDPAVDTKQADYFAQRAIGCDHLEPMAFAVQGHVAAYLHKDFDLAFASFETALRINPNSARAWLWNASAHAWTGDGRRAVEKINRAMALSPYDPLICAYSVSASMAYLADGQYGRSIELALRCIGENRGYTSPYKLLVAALVLAGRRAEAQTPLHRLLQLEPGFTVPQFRRRFPGSAWPIGDIFCDALARAGTPLSG